jgi:hypothetical protein
MSVNIPVMPKGVLDGRKVAGLTLPETGPSEKLNNNPKD